MFLPLPSLAVVFPDPAQPRSLILHDVAPELPLTGVVLAAGRDTHVQPGQRVLFSHDGSSRGVSRQLELPLGPSSRPLLALVLGVHELLAVWDDDPAADAARLERARQAGADAYPYRDRAAE